MYFVLFNPLGCREEACSYPQSLRFTGGYSDSFLRNVQRQMGIWDHMCDNLKCTLKRDISPLTQQ